ncbi:MAG: hypothetical protein CMF55_06575 [Legionellales bacterium]|nr:hypothetical protein [Legionellales bacterium]
MNNLKILTFLSLFFCAAKGGVTQAPLKPSSRSQGLHDQFVQLHDAAEQGSTVFGYWCGPTEGGYCGSTDFSDINVAAVTHAPFAFASISDQGYVSLNYDAPIDTTQLLNQGVIPGISLGGAAANPNNCLDHIDTCVTTLGGVLETYEQLGSPFFFVDSDFESPEDSAQMDRLIQFWLAFRQQYPEYLITMAPECAYLWCGDASWPYNAYVSVINQLGPYGADLIYRINVQAYNNWCSLTASAGEQQFNEDVASTFVNACSQTGYLGLSNNTEIFGLGVLGANQDGEGYTPPETLASSLDAIDESFGTRNAMFWDTLTDLNNRDGQWAISSAMVEGLTQSPTISPADATQETHGQQDNDLLVYGGLVVGGVVSSLYCGVFCCNKRSSEELSDNHNSPLVLNGSPA